MKALVYYDAHEIKSFSIKEEEVPEPTLLDHDVLVEVKAVAANPVDYKIRKSRSAENGRPVILGWDASGVIRKIGRKVAKFKVGDEVYYAGDLIRDGCYAEYQAVDSRIIARKPHSLSHIQAAAIPLTALTAYEALILQTTTQYSRATKVLIIGGAGGVGSMSIQLLKALTESIVIATASREETIRWCLDLGADRVVDHNLLLESKGSDVGEVHFVFSTTHSDKYVPLFPVVLKPFGHLTLIDDPGNFDIKPLKRKSITVSWELMFTKTLYGFDLESQGATLAHVASLVDAGAIKTTATTVYQGLTPENIRRAHEALEEGTSIGKIVFAV